MKKQKQFTFRFYKQEIHPKNTILPGFDVGEDMKQRLLRRGYLVKDLRQVEAVVVTCYVAKANIPYQERERFQEQIDNDGTQLVQGVMPSV